MFPGLLRRDSCHRLEQADVLLLCHDVDRSVSLGGIAYSPLIDSVGEDLEARGWSCQRFAYPFSELLDDSGWGMPRGANRSMLVAMVKDKLGGGWTGGSCHCRRGRNVGRVYGGIIDAVEPKCIINIGSPKDLCWAAHDRGVPVFELLHGMGYTAVEWGWDLLDPPCLPSGILSLDTVSTDTFSALQSKHIRVREIPHPFLKRFYDPDALPAEWHPSRGVVDNRGRKEILVSLQWGYAGDHGRLKHLAGILPNGLFPSELACAVEQTREDVFWRFRLHPVQMRKRRYLKLRRYLDEFTEYHPNTEWRISSTLPLPSILWNCAGHITMASMVSYEASVLGVSTYLMCPTIGPSGAYRFMFEDLVADGYAERGTLSVGAIVEWARRVERLLGRGLGAIGARAWEDAVKWMLGATRAGP